MPLTEQEEFELLSLEREKAMAQQQDQPQEQSRVATPDQYLSGQERFETGFRVNPEQFLEQKRASMGLSKDTPLEPTPQTASLIQNIKDLPLDIVDIIGPAFPAIGQIIGGSMAGAASIPTTGGTAAPMAIAGGGVAGAVGGETLRQAIGEFLNLEDKPLTERAKKVALEGAFGAVGEAAYFGGSMALRATKKGLIKAGEKLLSAKGLEGFVKTFGKITRNLGPDEFQHALVSLRQGDDSVIKKAFASKDFGDRFARELFFGEKVSSSGKILKKGNIGRQIRNLASRKDAREPVKQLYKEFLGLSDETFDMAVKYGQNIDNFGSKGVINEIKAINKKLPQMFDDVGKRLGQARSSLAKRVPGADVSQELSAVNKMLGDELTNIGMLNRVSDGVYALNPEYAITAQGRGQTKSLIEFVDKFFSKTSGANLYSDAQIEMLAKKGTEGLEEIFKMNRKTFFSAQTTAKFGDFAKQMRALESQITGKEFQQLGKLSPNLTTYMQGLRGITEKVADQYGYLSVKALSNEYKALAQNAELLRVGSKVKDVDELSRVLSKYINPKDVIEQEQAKALDSFLKKQVGSNVFEKVRGFKALNQLRGIETDLTRTGGRQSFVNMMRSAFGEGTSVKRDLIEKTIDPFLPKNLKIALNAKNHTTALALQEDAISILKARFLSSGIGIPALAGGLTGGFIGGKEGATIGLGAGFALQNPKLLQLLIKAAAKAPSKKAIQVGLPQVSRTPVVAGTQLLKSLIQKNQ